MSNFWTGYILGRSGGGGSIPPGLIVIFGVFLVLALILYVLQGIFNAIAQATRSAPLLSLFAVGVLAAGIGEAIGTSSDLDVTSKILTPGTAMVLLTGIFWVLGVLSGAADFEQAPLIFKVPMAILSVLIVGSFAYMALSMFKYRCETTPGRIARAGGVVLLAWWGWASLFSLPLPAIAVLDANTFLVLGVIAAFLVGFVESGTLARESSTPSQSW